MTSSNLIKLILLALLWGGSYIFVEIALGGFGPLTLVLVRVTLAAAALWIVALAQGHSLPRDLRLWGDCAVMGLLANVLPFTLIAWGQQSITAGVASILNASVPIFTVLIAHRFSSERFTRRKGAGILLGFYGVVILMGHSAMAGPLNLNFGMLAALLAAACYGAGAVYGKRLSGTPPIVNAAIMLACSSLMLAPLALQVESPLAKDPTTIHWLAVAALAILSSAIAYLIYFDILKSSGATNLSLVTFLIPIVSVLMGMLFLSEAIRAGEIVGMAVIFSGIAILNPSLMRSLGAILHRFRDPEPSNVPSETSISKPGVAVAKSRQSSHEIS